MALSGVEIFKLLPKTNCKKCGHPTCLAFAMKLAQRQVSIDLCPDVSEEAKQKLGEASAPPIRPVTIGSGDRTIKMGEETVLFRHEKKFINPCALAVEIKDTMSEGEVLKVVQDVLDSEIDRVGQRLWIDAIFISNASGDGKRFEDTLRVVHGKAPQVPLIIATDNPASAEAVLKITKDIRPLLYGANETNFEAMAKVAKDMQIPLGVVAKGLEALSALTEKVKAVGIQDMVIDSGARTAKEIIADNTCIRRAAIKKGFKPLGYPIITFAQREDAMLETCLLYTSPSPRDS